MYLMYYLDPETNKRVYTLRKIDGNGTPTYSAHPARFSPEDRFARERIKAKKRFKLMENGDNDEEKKNKNK